MAHFYVGADRDQQFLMPLSMADWLDEGHLAWFVIDVVAQIDTARLHARHPNDGVGRPAYDPDMMLALLFYAYGSGLRSSRRIEAACRSDAAFRVICGSVTAERKATERAQREAAEAAGAKKLRGRTPGPDRALAQAAAALEAARVAAAEATPVARVANTTDPDSRIMKSAKGWVQGFNAQAAANANQIVVACDVSQDANDVGLYEPMVQMSQENLAAVSITDPVGLVTADAGYWSEDNATADGPDRLIATQKDWKQRRAAREMGTTTGPPPDDATPLEAMEHRLRTPEGAAAYATRSHTIEPLFGDHKANRGWRGFRRRGLTAVRSEWAFMNASHNLAKLFAHQGSQQVSLA